MTIVYGLLGLGLIIFIHELGHFIAARLCGVTVESFSIGMGPILFHKKIGITDYRLSLIPLGGYCGMKGEKAFQKALEQKLDHIPKEKNSFYGVHPFKRIIIAFSGPFSNFVFAIIAMSIIAMIGYTYYTTPSRIILANEIYEGVPSRAADVGLKTGDVITSINGKNIEYFSDISQTVTISPEESLSLNVRRDNQSLNFIIQPELDKTTGAGRIGIVNWVDTIIQDVQLGSFAHEAGLIAGDRIIEVEGFPVANTIDFDAIIQNKKYANIVYERNGIKKTVLLILPEVVENGEALTIADIGIQWQRQAVQTQTYGFFPAFAVGTKETFNLLGLTVKSLGLLFRGIDLTKAVSGPIGITIMLGETAKAGFSAGFSVGLITVLNFLALISISLFLMNLLPIPILDGGLILFSSIECIRKKAIKPMILYRVQFIGIGFIVILFAIGLFGDINRIIASLTGTP